MGTESAIVLNIEAVEEAMGQRGIRSIQALAKKLGYHRNTFNAYFSGHRALPEALEKLIVELELPPAAVLKLVRPNKRLPALPLQQLIKDLHRKIPEAAIVLFGSRARGEGKKYSDYDLGIYQEPELSLDEYSKLLSLVAQWNATHFSTAQLVNLTNADSEFLISIREDVVFLAGDFQAWCDFLRRCKVSLHE